MSHALFTQPVHLDPRERFVTAFIVHVSERSAANHWGCYKPLARLQMHGLSEESIVILQGVGKKGRIKDRNENYRTMLNKLQ